MGIAYYDEFGYFPITKPKEMIADWLDVSYDFIEGFNDGTFRILVPSFLIRSSGYHRGYDLGIKTINEWNKLTSSSSEN